MIATSAHRVAEQTSDVVNDQIRRTTDMNIAYFAAHPEEIDRRLMELDQEWDIERALEVGASGLSIFGLVMGILGRSRWLLVPLTVQGFLLQHAVQGWCPPMSALRRLGVRTPAEIEAERYALKAIKGDFRDLGEDEPSGSGGESRADRVLRAIRGEQQRAATPDSHQVGRKRRRKSSRVEQTVGEESVETPATELGLDEDNIPKPDIGPTS